MLSEATSLRDTLFDRLGGAEGIAALIDDVVTAHTENALIKSRFLPYLKDPARLAVIKKHTCQLLAAGGGGPTLYEGRSMKETHAGMNVSAAEYVAATDDILLALRGRNLDEQTQKDVLWMVYSLKADIVHG